MTTPPLDEPFTAGRVVQRREVLHGHLWLTHPVTVVDDRGGVLAVLLEPGSPFTFPPHPFGPHPWSHQSAWGSTSVLQLHRGGNPYSVWRFFTDGVFTHWYVNLEAPIVRHPDATGGGAYDTDDHGIDIVVPADGSPWQWKDLDDPAAWVATGRITEAEADQIHADARAVAHLLDTDQSWWAQWDSWAPPTALESTAHLDALGR